jgi:hypothetical protein
VKPGLLLILVSLFVSPLLAQGPDKVMSCHVRNVPFTEFCEVVLRETGVKIFYREDWINKRYVTLDADSITARSALRTVLEGTDLRVSAWHNDLVILPGVKLLSALPGYEPAVKTGGSEESKEKTITESEERYITGRKPGVTQTITIGRTGSFSGRSKARVLGRILDEETGEPMSFVAVYIDEIKSGAVTDASGFFNLTLTPGRYNVSVEYLGYEKQKFLFEIYSDGTITLKMNKAAVQLNEVVVSSERHSGIRAKDPGFDQVSMKSIKTLPMMMGERDILKVSVTLPGIVSVGEGSAGLNVRGSSSDQNAFYINRIPIYNTFHLFGFFPAFNPDIIKDLSIYKGFIPVQYGGRLASVFNITSRQGNRKRFTAHGGISPVTANIVLEGPVKKDTSSFLFSARSSYSDWILSRIKDPTISESSANFNDFSGGMNWDIQKTQLSLFLYHSYDRFSLSDINSYDYANSGASVIAGHTFSNSLRGEFAITGSQYDFSIVDKEEISSAYQHAYKMDHLETRADFRQLLNEKNTLEYGADIVFYKLDRGTVLPYGDKSLRSAVALGVERGVESSLFVSDSYNLTERINFVLGVRYTLFNPVGPDTTFKYTDGAPRDTRYIEDTLIFGKNEVICWYHEPEIRAAINIQTDKEGSIKLAFNQMHQNLFMLNTVTTVAPNTQWKIADYHLIPSRSNLVSMGFFRTLPKNGLELSAEVYYKRIYNYSEFKDGADFLKNAAVETSVLQGDQKAYGLELYARRTRRKLEGWLSYTYSRSFVQVNGDNSWYRINNGEAYPANFDVPHSFNAVLNYYITRRIFFSSILTYQTGKPITYPESAYYVDGTPYLDYSKRNAYRIPDYFRADFSLTFEGDLRRNKFLHNSFILSLYNATGRNNPYSVYFKTENGRINSYQYSVIGVPIFTATWLFKLGNYVSD